MACNQRVLLGQDRVAAVALVVPHHNVALDLLDDEPKQKKRRGGGRGRKEGEEKKGKGKKGRRRRRRRRGRKEGEKQ